MQPYFDNGRGIVLYHGDCREVLPTLARDSVDLIVTDPPYGMAWESGRRDGHPFGPISGDESTVVALEGLRLALPSLRRGRHLYVFGRHDFSTFPISEPVELIWDKEQMTTGNLGCRWGRQHEYIQFAVYNISKANLAGGAGRLSARLRRGSVLRYPRLNAVAVQQHPTEKPVGLLRELIESSSLFGETVLDPFAGVGSALVAAVLEGRNAIGIEIEERYCEVAARRLEQMPLPLAEAI